MPIESTSPEGQSTWRRVRGLIIVARDQPDLWASLTQHFVWNEDVQVLLDRRRRDRRQRVQTLGQERRGADRRRPPRIETDVRFRQFVIVRPEH
jgi:hypothetical protein